jgi:hypothetical protein
MDIKGPWEKIRANLDQSDEGVIAIYRRDMNDIQGTTGFFRHPVLLDQLINYLDRTPFDHDPRVLVAPASIGCEAYSFAIAAHERGLLKKYPGMEIYALDIAPEFVAIGKNATYPAQFQSEVPKKYESYFLKYAQGPHEFTQVRDVARRHVIFLPAQSISDHKPDEPYDLATCLHLIRHMQYTPQMRRDVLASLFGMARLTCVNNILKLDRPTLRDAFRTARGNGLFAALDENMQPMASVGADLSPRSLDQFDRSRSDTDEMYVFRPGF